MASQLKLVQLQYHIQLTFRFNSYFNLSFTLNLNLNLKLKPFHSSQFTLFNGWPFARHCTGHKQAMGLAKGWPSVGRWITIGWPLASNSNSH